MNIYIFDRHMKYAISTMCKNQGNRLVEWVNYHHNLGFNKFIIYLDNCDDNSYEILKSLNTIDISIYETKDIDINYKNPDWISRSHKMYNHCLKKYNNCEWICFIEVDEFIYPQKKDINVTDFLNNLNSDCLYINSWDFKGPFDENKPILNQSNLIWSDSQRFNSIYKYRGKSIIKPQKFHRCVDAHHFSYKNKISNQFKINRENLLQTFYGDEVTIDDTLFKIYHFRNHTPKEMNNYIKINNL